MTALLTLAATLAFTTGQATSPRSCSLAPGGARVQTTSECTACHSGVAGRHAHPVDVGLVPSRSLVSGGPRTALRTSVEAVRRGVFLPDGKITCLTCHDGNSAHPFRLAVPVEAGARAPAAWRPGTRFDPSPLCRACHVVD